jgi:hypothetical protein
MKFLNISLSILLVLSFLMIPTCVFADENPFAGSGTITHSSSNLNNLNPMVKGSSGGGKSSSSSKVKTDSDDDSGNSTDDGSGGSWIWIIIAIIVIIALIFGVWYFLLRNR